MFKSPKECQASLDYLSPLQGIIGNDHFCCWIQRKSAKSVEISYRASWPGITCSEIVAREISRRFSVVRFGAGSVGWYSNKEWKCSDGNCLSSLKLYGEQTTWANWIKNFKLEWDYSVQMSLQKGFLPDADVLLHKLREIETFVVEAFTKLDSKVAQITD